jgi:hypothetical protein
MESLEEMFGPEPAPGCYDDLRFQMHEMSKSGIDDLFIAGFVAGYMQISKAFTEGLQKIADAQQMKYPRGEA